MRLRDRTQLTALRELKADAPMRATIGRTLIRADGTRIELPELHSDDARGLVGWVRRKREEWQTWQQSKEYLRAGGFPHRNFLSWQLRNVRSWVRLEDGVVHFVDVGKAWVITKIRDTSATTMNQSAWGTGAVVPTEGSTQLSTEASEARITATISSVTTTFANDTFQALALHTANAGKTITNAGLFDSATAGAGTALIIGDHAGVPVLLNDQIEYTFKLQADQ